MRPGPNGSGLSRKAILFELDQSLRRLKTDFIDLYQIHRWDPNTPIEETMETLNDVVRAGKVRYIGASSMHSWQFVKAQFLAKRKRLGPLHLHAEPLQPPLPRGRARDGRRLPRPGHRPHSMEPARPRPPRPSRRRRPHQAPLETDKFGATMYAATEAADKEVINALDAISKEKNQPMASVALAWLLHKPGVVSPIFGASKPGQLEDAVRSLDITLTPDDLQKLEASYTPHPVLGF